MSFGAANDRVWLTDTAGHVVFDTDRRMFAVTDLVTGSITIANKPSNNSGQQVASHVLANLNPQAEFCMGQVQATGGPAGGGLPNVGVFSAGGSIVWGWYREYTLRTMRGFWTVTFRAGGGQLRLEEEWWNQSSGTHPFLNLTLVGGTLTYRIYCGTFV